MSENLRNYTKALYGMDAVVQRVPADGWGRSTPCEGWTARDLVVHCISVMAGLRKQAETGEFHLPPEVDVGDDVVAAWNEARDATLETLDRPGVIGLEGNYWNGPGTIDDLLAFAMWDPLTHSWDLATAVGLDAPGTDELAAAAMSVIQPMAPSLRDMGLLADPVEVPAGASTMDRFLGLVGRDPSPVGTG